MGLLHLAFLSTLTHWQGRMQWLRNLALIAGGEQRAKDLLEAKGISLILKGINVNFRVRLISALRLSFGLKRFPSGQ